MERSPPYYRRQRLHKLSHALWQRWTDASYVALARHRCRLVRPAWFCRTMGPMELRIFRFYCRATPRRQLMGCRLHLRTVRHVSVSGNACVQRLMYLTHIRNVRLYRRSCTPTIVSKVPFETEVGATYARTAACLGAEVVITSVRNGSALPAEVDAPAVTKKLLFVLAVASPPRATCMSRDDLSR